MKFMQLIFPLTNAPKIHELPAIQAYVFLGVLIVFCVAGNCCWKALVNQHRSKRVVSVDKVLDELKDEGDELSEWATDTVPDSFFKQTQDQAVIDVFQAMVEWVYAEPQFTIAARTEFASVADGLVMAYAKANGLILVTHEEHAPQVKKRVPMPNVCIEFDIDYVDTFTMLRDLKAKFVLGTKRPRKR